nr:immunoglobulin heavy chain junction region [Macaca mulatta]MOW93646.1 immunoglobulin heavy chain junction region [Macaca mulatta]MOW93680.1 immunoglobulin heavy chain junction region [Macaca mulatta]MOW93813.1 immunoglobulin heavy chain junction region [Macaca mulatta]MOW93832.1 immunoglobulin heavy chain junction region [Macaca mulatta]
CAKEILYYYSGSYYWGVHFYGLDSW